MSIADRINSMSNNLSSAYGRIAYLGVDTSSIDKNIQNLSTVLDTVYNDYPKVSDEGISPSLSGTKVGRLSSTLKGNTSQYTTTGKNLFKNIPKTITNRNITMTNDGKKISFSGTNSSSSEYPSFTFYADGSVTASAWWADTNWLHPEKGYFDDETTGGIISIIKSGTFSGSRINIRFGRTNTYEELNINSSTNNYETSSNKKSINFISIGFDPSQTVNVDFQIQYEYGNTVTPYEPYTGGVPSPNPNYPQLVNVVKGENSITVFDKNWFDTNTVAQNRELNYGVIQYSSASDLYYQKVKVGEIYTFSRKSTDYSGYIGFSDEIPVTGVKVNDVSNLSGLTSITKTATYQYVVIQLRKTEDLSETMLELGPTASTYSPYTGITLPITLPVGMELCKIGDYQDYFYGWIDNWYKYGMIGKKIVDGTEGTFSYPSTNRFNVDGLITDVFRLTNEKNYLTNNYQVFKQTANNADFNSLVSNVDYGFNFSSNQSTYTIRFKDTRYTSIDDFKTSLSNNNLLIYYALATPTTTRITDTTLISQLNALYNAMSYNGQTNILQTNADLPFIISASALKGA